jgi:hypothetical protein
MWVPGPPPPASSPCTCGRARPPRRPSTARASSRLRSPVARPAGERSAIHPGSIGSQNSSSRVSRRRHHRRPASTPAAIRPAVSTTSTTPQPSGVAASTRRRWPRGWRRAPGSRPALSEGGHGRHHDQPVDQRRA